MFHSLFRVVVWRLVKSSCSSNVRISKLIVICLGEVNQVVEVESKVQAKRERRAQWEAEGVVQDIQAVLKISDVSYGLVN